MRDGSHRAFDATHRLNLCDDRVGASEVVQLDTQAISHTKVVVGVRRACALVRGHIVVRDLIARHSGRVKRFLTRVKSLLTNCDAAVT